MCAGNQTSITHVTLLGFGNLFHLKNTLFIIFLLIYILSLTGNILIVSFIYTNPKLHSPMYFFLGNLALCEMLFTTAVIPNMLYVIWGNGGAVPLYFCFTQFYLYASTGASEILLLMIMAYDRYLAICIPLRYASVMNVRTRNYLTLMAWILGFFVMSISTSGIGSLQFCHSDKIDHFFCDVEPILQLSSTNTYLVEIEVLVITALFCLFPFVLIILSYLLIFLAIIRISSKSGRRKSFSTCSSHLMSVCMYFGTLFIIYLGSPQIFSKKLSKAISLVYIVLTPLFNPLIYSLRNQEMKNYALILLKGSNK